MDGSNLLLLWCIEMDVVHVDVHRFDELSKPTYQRVMSSQRREWLTRELGQVYRENKVNMQSHQRVLRGVCCRCHCNIQYDSAQYMRRTTLIGQRSCNHIEPSL